MKPILESLINGQSLSKAQAYESLLGIGKGQQNPSQIAGFLVAIQQKGISVEELDGFREAMLELALSINLSDFDAMDLVGTGGDGKNTFNISTTSAFVVAGAGQKIAKHGNHGVSSPVGSSTVLEYLGVPLTNDESILKNKLEKANICFFHAPLFHPAMKHVGSIRKELGIKTFFNILGPLLNPALVSKQLLGVYNESILSLYEALFKRIGGTYGLLYSLDGYDEISLTGAFKLVRSSGNMTLMPSDLGLPLQNPTSISDGGSLEDSAKILVSVLENKATPAQKNVVLANAGTALSIARNISLEGGVSQARESIDSGKALKCLKKLTEK